MLLCALSWGISLQLVAVMGVYVWETHLSPLDDEHTSQGSLCRLPFTCVHLKATILRTRLSVM